MSISEQQVRDMAGQARLDVTEEEVAQFREELSKLLEFAEKLNELDTENVEPTNQVLSGHNVLREDEVRPSWPRKQVLANAPETEDGQVKVPAIFDE